MTSKIHLKTNHLLGKTRAINGSGVKKKRKVLSQNLKFIHILFRREFINFFKGF